MHVYTYAVLVFHFVFLMQNEEKKPFASPMFFENEMKVTRPLHYTIRDCIHQTTITM